MTTKPPSPVQPAPADSMEHIAYASVAEIPTLESHDRDRLGYVLTLWLRNRRDPFETVIRSTRARFLIPESEAIRQIKDRLTAKGVAI